MMKEMIGRKKLNKKYFYLGYKKRENKTRYFSQILIIVRLRLAWKIASFLY
ncbi:hypothetical protein J2Z38_000082 [Anaerococcus degeneri]|nr:hypothetical protein [Anaerococcus degeneri]